MNSNNDLWNYMFTVYVGLIQMLDYSLNMNQTSNDELMKELQKQEQILDEQTHKYLKKIVEQNKEIIKQNNDILKYMER